MTALKKIIASLIITLALASTVSAAIGIPEYLTPKNAGMKGVNKAVTEQVKKAEKGGEQDAAVVGVNIILQYMANLLLFLAAPLAVLFIAHAGQSYTFAMGDETKLESAKRELTWALLGLLLIMMSYVIVRLLIQPLPLLQDATDAKLGTGDKTTQADGTGTPGTGSGKTALDKFLKNLENNIIQVEKNAKNIPKAFATMYDPSGYLNGVDAYIKYDGEIFTYYFDGKTDEYSVGRDNFTELLKQYAIEKDSGEMKSQLKEVDKILDDTSKKQIEASQENSEKLSKEIDKKEFGSDFGKVPGTGLSLD